MWKNSFLNNTNLNTNYINYLNGINPKWTNMLVETTWQVGGNTYANIATAATNVAYQNEISNPAESTIFSDEVGIVYVSDYGFATDPSNWEIALSEYDTENIVNTNWMFMGITEWTLTPVTDSDGIFVIGPSGDVGASFNTSSVDVTRPVFFLNSNVKFNNNGNGAKSSSYRLSL